MSTVLTSLLDRLGGPRRALIALAGLGLSIGVLAFGRWASTPALVPAFAGLPVEQAARIDDALTKAGITHELGKGGTEISVAAGDVARAQVALAKAGVTGRTTRGLELFENQTWGMTDFAQKVNYRRALEGELERTIGEMRGVERADVALALNETATIRRAAETPPQASVVLSLSSGTVPGPDVVQGIQHLVAASVSGVTAERVAVLDDGGRLLSSPDDGAGSAAGLSSRQLGLRKEVEGYLQQKAQAILDQAVGAGNAKVQVSADIGFDKLQRTSQTVDPDRQALSTEQKAEIVPGSDGGAGSTNSASAYENSKTVETFEAAVGNVKRMTVAVLVNHRTQAPAAAPAGAPAGAPADSAQAAAPVLVARSAEEIGQLEALVRTAVGADSGRGDVVRIVNLPFETRPLPVEAAAPATSLLQTVRDYERPVLSLLGLVLAAGIALMTLRALATPVARGALASGGAAPMVLPGGSPALDAGAGAGGAVLVKRSAPSVQIEVGDTVLRDQAVQVSEQNPEDAARVFRAWLREG